MENNITRVAIDGPAAAGKSTVAKMVADQLAFVYVDTGAMYRALTLKVINEKIQIENERAVIDLLQQTSIDLIQNKRSEERRVGKECRYQMEKDHKKER